VYQLKNDKGDYKLIFNDITKIRSHQLDGDLEIAAKEKKAFLEHYPAAAYMQFQ